ncbi:hypothetical protein OOU_Y34scaffold01017g2 [Pyricularia oryzae Y34]|uniref:Uncharacterized protein n=1 Tax=Pyricularia oryzae (strain Y34) TaxID=1143189 RepID=A0AA97PFP1_PYRO3|nr:hypothetical protein OOU_Y34scaffold01017g2 [Pyricularia oryzae Y34]
MCKFIYEVFKCGHYLKWIQICTEDEKRQCQPKDTTSTKLDCWCAISNCDREQSQDRREGPGNRINGGFADGVLDMSDIGRNNDE